MALMIGALVLHGVQPGPAIITEQPMVFWGLIASMWIGNVFLLVLNLPLIALWVRMAFVPYHFLFPSILVFCAIGVYSLNNATFDIYLMAIFGLLGYLLRKIDCEPAPMLLGFILGPMMEEHLRRAMLMSNGDGTVFVTRPLSAVTSPRRWAMSGYASEPESHASDFRYRRMSGSACTASPRKPLSRRRQQARLARGLQPVAKQTP